MYYTMATRKNKVRKGYKTQKICEYCGKICSNSSRDFIHKKCALAFLESQGYVILDLNLRRVFELGGENGSS